MTGKIEVFSNNQLLEAVDMKRCIISGFDNTKLGKQTLSVSYNYLGVTITSSFEVSIVSTFISKVEMNTNPAKLTYLEAKDALNVVGGKIKVIYDNGTNEIIDLQNSMVSGFDNAKVGRQTLVVSYTQAGITKTTTYDVTITEKSLSKVEMYSIPKKLTYLEGKDILDVAGGKIKVTYDNGTTSIVDITSSMVSGFNNSKEGKQTLTVSYSYSGITKTTTYDVTITGKSLSRIEINTNPTKLSYMQSKDTLDVSGGKIKAYYSNGTSEIINMTSSMISGFDNSKVGKQTLTVSYSYGGTTKQTSYTIEVVKKSLLKIEMHKVPNQIYLNGMKETFDPAGGQIKAFYNDGTSEVINITKFMTSGYIESKVGLQVIDVKYTYDGVTKTTHYSIENAYYELGSLDGDDKVDVNDALQLLYFTFFPEQYSINQSCDFDGDGTVDAKDALYLLFYTFFPEQYPLHDMDKEKGGTMIATTYESKGGYIV